MVTKFFHVLLVYVAHVEGLLLLLLGLLLIKRGVVTSIVDDLLLLLWVGLAVPVVSMVREVAILTEVL